MKNSSVRFLLETLASDPGGICVADGQKSLDFRAFFSAAFWVSRVLAERGHCNVPVLVFMPKCVEAIASFAAVLLSGNFYVPIDVSSPATRNRKILRDLDPPAILTLRALADQVADLGVRAEDIVFFDEGDKADGLDSEEMLEACRRQIESVIDTDPCYVMYTSGSTGTPKGVVVSHRGVIDYIDWAVANMPVGGRDVIGNQSPVFFDNSTLDIYLSWATGAELLLVPEDLFMFPVRLVEFLERLRVTFVFFVPSVLINVAVMKGLKPGRLPELRTVAFAGEVMPTKHLAHWQRMLPKARFMNLYGPTEITVDCTFFVVDRIYGPEESLPIGHPCSNSDVLILNEQDRPAKTGESGELCVRGSSLALGYWNDPEKTRRAFTQNPLHDRYEDKIYRTGDIVYRDELGRIMFVGRKDSQIKHMGYRIELGEIERAVDSLPDVAKSCVLYNARDQELTLFYESDQEIEPGQMRRQLASLLPAYMVPRRLERVAKLPLNASGKVDRKALADD